MNCTKDYFRFVSTIKPEFGMFPKYTKKEITTNTVAFRTNDSAGGLNVTRQQNGKHPEQLKLMAFVSLNLAWWRNLGRRVCFDGDNLSLTVSWGSLDDSDYIYTTTIKSIKTHHCCLVAHKCGVQSCWAPKTEMFRNAVSLILFIKLQCCDIWKRHSHTHLLPVKFKLEYQGWMQTILE